MTSAILFLSKIKSKKLYRAIHLFIIVGSLLIIFIVGPYLFYTIAFMGKVYPNIYISGVNIGGKTPEDAASLLSNSSSHPITFNLVSQTKFYEIGSNDLGVSYNFNESVNRAYNLERTGNFVLDVGNRINLIFRPKKLALIIDLDKSKLNTLINTVSREVSVYPEYPSIKLINENVEVNKGTAGMVVDQNKLEANIRQQISFQNDSDIFVPVKVEDPTLNEFEILSAKTHAAKYLGKSLTFKFEEKTYTLNSDELFKLLDPKNKYNDSTITDVTYNVAFDINHDPQIPKFEFDGKKVTEFSPANDGVSVDTQAFKDQLIDNLNKLADSLDQSVVFDIPVVYKKPPVSTAEVNNLGIKERIGHGSSTYFHSIPGRVFNVNLAASRINGALVAPGETFSFNQTLGDVSKFTGYQQAYIISGGKTILGDGGGVCQVSTTLFRAVMNAGLPIDARSAHAYRVGYYEQGSPPGMDATVYYPTTDFKFTNNTENYILIQAKNDPKNYSLVFDLYGTSDGRVSEISKPIISNYSAPLPTVYQDDPTLPLGTLKQTDYAAAGAKITFNYSVIKNGQNIYQKTFVSNYQPWAAIFLRGTKI